jgi:hypothetical protein
MNLFLKFFCTFASEANALFLVRVDKIKTQKIAADFASMNAKPSCMLAFKATKFIFCENMN